MNHPVLKMNMTLTPACLNEAVLKESPIDFPSHANELYTPLNVED